MATRPSTATTSATTLTTALSNMNTRIATNQKSPDLEELNVLLTQATALANKIG